jgi:hypothetical protein
MIGYALISFALPDAAPVNGEVFGAQHPAKTILNVILFIVGAASILLGPISFIVGIVMLVKRKSQK